MGSSVLSAGLALLAIGAVMALLYFLAGVSGGLRAGRSPEQAAARRRRRVDTVRGLLLLAVVSIFGGVAFGRVLLLGLGVICLALAWLTWRYR